MQFILLFCRFSLRRMCVECELVDGVLFYSFILPLSLSFSESALLLLVQPIITLLCPTWNSVCYFFFRLSLTNFQAFPPSTSSFRRDQPVNVFFFPHMQSRKHGARKCSYALPEPFTHSIHKFHRILYAATR